MNNNQSIRSTILHFIHSKFIWLILASYIVASVLPGFGLWIRHLSLGELSVFGLHIKLSMPQIMLAFLLFNAGFGVNSAELHKLLANPALLFYGVLGNVLTPVCFIAGVSFLMKSWPDADEVQQILVGLALVAAMPIAGASTAWSQNANGNLALSLGLVLLTTFLSPLITPVVLHAVGFVTSGDYAEDLHELAENGVVSFLGIWVILPSVLGILVRKQLTEESYATYKNDIKLFNYCILILLNYSNAALTLPEVLSEPDWDYLILILVVVSSLCFAAFGTGYWISNVFKVDKQNKVAIMFGLGMNNNGTGLVLASVALADHPQVLLPIIFYNLVQHLIASVVDRELFANKEKNLHS